LTISSTIFKTDRGSLIEGSGYKVEYMFFVILPNTFATNLFDWCEKIAPENTLLVIIS
jgi:hypothetical protein